MKTIGFLGSGAWGITLANTIASNGYKVLLWSIEEDVLESIEKGLGHPKFPHYSLSSNICVTRSLKNVLEQDILVECVTASGFRSVCEKIQSLGGIKQPFIITSKGIEQDSGLLLVEVAYEIFQKPDLIACLSGPTLAKEVMDNHPTSAVIGATTEELLELGKQVFHSPLFNIYKNFDILGVALGGSIKNVIAIACGLSEGLGYGFNTRALLITRGLQEMCTLARIKGAHESTCYGLSGIGDLIVTGISNLSRNYRFGLLLGQGLSQSKAKQTIGAVVEGQYTTRSAYNLAQNYHLDLPIISGIYHILYENAPYKESFLTLLNQEHRYEFA